MKRLKYLWVGISFLGMTLGGCSDDNDPQADTEVLEDDRVIDELAVLQKALVKVDENGKFVERVRGVALNPSDTTVVSMGVDSYEEAVREFRSLFHDTTTVSTDGTKAAFVLKSGSAELKKGDGTDGLLAFATFDVPGLKYVSRINFILDSAWPENATVRSSYTLGATYMFQGWTDDSPSTAVNPEFKKTDVFRYVCIRADKNGKPALLVALTPTPFFLNWVFTGASTGNLPNEDKAKEISDIIRNNWGTYLSYFNQQETVLKTDSEYWIDEGYYAVFTSERYTICLYSGKLESREVNWKRPDRQVMFYLECGSRQ